jgi:hypothetical protein
MTKQNKNLIALAVLIVATGISYRINRIVPPVIPLVSKAQAAKAAQQDNPLAARFRRVRAEMDGLYHYRIKPIPFDNSANPFRLSTDIEIATAPPQPAAITKAVSERIPVAASKDELGDALLAHAIAVARLGGVVVMNDTTQLIVDGQLHKEGDVFTVKVRSRLVLIRIKYLSTTFATLSLDDPQSGVAEIKIGLK